MSNPQPDNQAPVIGGLFIGPFNGKGIASFRGMNDPDDSGWPSPSA
jgi:hypothetical protein